MKYIDLKQKQIQENRPSETINISKGWSNLSNSPMKYKNKINITKNFNRTYITKNYTKNVTSNLIQKVERDSLLKDIIRTILNFFIMLAVVNYKIIISVTKLLIKGFLLCGIKLSQTPSPKWFDKLMDKMNKTGGKYED